MSIYETNGKYCRIFKDLIDLMLTKDIMVSDAIQIFKDCAEQFPEYVEINTNK